MVVRSDEESITLFFKCRLHSPQGKIAETIRLTRQFCVDMGCIGKHGDEKKRVRTNNEPKIAVAGVCA